MRLIDADKLKTIIQEVIEESNFKPFKDILRKMCDILDKSPTVDAVEVVRCKDCRHYDKDALWCNKNSYAFGEEYHNWYADCFCSFGERKDND